MPSHPPRAHWLDHIVAFASGRRRLFMHGWGDEAVLARLATVARFEEPPSAITLDWSPPRREGAVEVSDGTFLSPIADLPQEARRAHVRRLLPAKLRRGERPLPMYVVLAASSDEGFRARTWLWRPLIERGAFGVLMLENAMYGLRRPKGQKGPSIRTVSDHLLMNASMVEEGRALLDWLAAEGHTRLGVAGFSMGGSMAALVAAVTPRPLAAAILAAGRSASPVFTEGLLARGIDFEALGEGSGGVVGARERLGKLFAVADLERHPVPRRPDATLLVAGRRDGYVFPAQAEALHRLWPGSELRWAASGHAGALLANAPALRKAATDAMERLSRG